MAKKYTIKSNRTKLYDNLLYNSPLPSNFTDFFVKFLNGSLNVGQNIADAQVFRDLKMENPNSFAIPFEEHIYDIIDGNPKRTMQQRKFPDYISDEVRELYEQKIWCGGPHWTTVRANKILPDNFRELVGTLRFPHWGVQEAEIDSRQNYQLRFGLKHGGVEAVCFNDDNCLESWLKDLANEYNTELMQEETEDFSIFLPAGTQYLLMPKYMYARGVQALRESYERGEHLLNRPLTFGENLQARLENPELFNTWIDSCTGIAYKAGTGRFKPIRECNQLINIEPGFNRRFIEIDYDSLDVEEFDSGDALYNQSLTREQVLSHPAWQAVVGNLALLEEYTNHHFDRSNRELGMGIYLRRNIDTDQLRPLYVNSIVNNSNADGKDYQSYDYARFAQAVAPSGAP
jgi:hypothetical protein